MQREPRGDWLHKRIDQLFVVSLIGWETGPGWRWRVRCPCGHHASLRQASLSDAPKCRKCGYKPATMEAVKPDPLPKAPQRRIESRNETMNRDARIHLRLCCRSYQAGRMLGYVSGLDAGPLSLSCHNNDWSPSLTFDTYHFAIEGTSFVMLHREHLPDQIEYEQITTTAGELARLLNWARSEQALALDEAPISIWHAWRSDQPFTPSHLKCLFD